MHQKGLGQCVDSKMMSEGLVAKNPSGTTTSSTSQGMEIRMTEPLQITEIAIILREDTYYHKTRLVGKKML